MAELGARRFRSVPIAASGTYVLTQLPPGDYLLAAISAAERANWLDREFLSAEAATATRLRVEPVEGEEWRQAWFLESLVNVSLPIEVKEGTTTRQALLMQ